MADLPELIHGGALTVGAATLLYAFGVLAATLTALLAPTAARRRAARDVLAILLRRHDCRDQ
jgi:hypothetical protein